MHQQIQMHLTKLAEALQQCGLWEESAPTAEALASREPFAIDYLLAPQWLQWIFIPKMQNLITQNQPLPNAIAISPYLEGALKEHPALGEILTPVLEMEALLQSN